MNETLQWGARFNAPPDPVLLAYGSSLEDDLVLAPFDAAASLAHVRALRGGAVIAPELCDALDRALERVASEIADGSFAAYARQGSFEDVHGAIDARVRALEPRAGAFLHAGRSRNDQVATTLALYAHDRAGAALAHAASIARFLASRAREERAAGTILAATTHLQPAQPVLFAYWLGAAAEPFVRMVRRFAECRASLMRFCPLGSAALAGSTLPLDRAASAAALGFGAPSRNGMDAVGTRDGALDVAHAFVRAAADASRISAELILWATPAFGYARLGDSSSTGSSLMPQKRNPDIFELVRGGASELLGLFTGALGSTVGLPLSYHRDLQQTKRMTIHLCERGLALLDAFARALADTSFDRDAMERRAADGYTVATDMAEALVRTGSSTREAHAHIGAIVAQAEADNTSLPGAPTVRESVAGKGTAGSTAPAAVDIALDALLAELDALEAAG